jgi:hypothetical protein
MEVLLTHQIKIAGAKQKGNFLLLISSQKYSTMHFIFLCHDSQRKLPASA